ncbi:MAG: mevalonate kinase [Caldilineaceae bacterium]
MTIAAAPGKVILVGEHAVVYGRPAIAVPVWETTATAEIVPGPAGHGCHITAAQIGLGAPLYALDDTDPLGLTVRLTLREAGVDAPPEWAIRVHSSIPIASGLGSGAAISAALVRAIYAELGRTPDPATVSRLVYSSEELYHGTPSGIDNTVIAYAMPVWFVKGHAPERFAPAAPFTLAIADSGITAPTKTTVGDVRRAWQLDPARYEALFDAIAAQVTAARAAMEQADWPALGACFDRNHALLQELDVSSPALDQLVRAAREAGALGAKLSGGGRGGNIIALVTPARTDAVRTALHAAGAAHVIVTTVAATSAAPGVDTTAATTAPDSHQAIERI